MNARRALVLAHQAARWPQCQALTSSSSCWRPLCQPLCQPVMKTPHAACSSLVCINNKTDTLMMNPKSKSIFTVTRSYASKKSAKKQANVQVSLTGLGELIEVETMIRGMESAVETMKNDFVRNLSLRSAGSLETMKVKFEGKEYELQQVAKMTRKGQQTIVVDMLSFPQMTKAVVDTLKTSALNLNPQQEGTTIYVPIPKVTKEHREILAKKAKALFITCRDAIRQVQEQFIKELRNGDIPDSERQSAYKQVKSLGDKYVLQSETMMKAKQEELVGK